MFPFPIPSFFEFGLGSAQFFDEVNCLTPLHIAAGSGQLELVNILLTMGNVDIDCQVGEYGFTPLHFATMANQVETVNVLISRGANVNLKCFQDFAALSFASQLGYLDIVNILIVNGADLRTKTDKFNTPLHFAALNGFLDVVKTLIEKGLDVNAANNDKVCPLHFAAVCGHLGMVKLLLEKGADVNAVDRTNLTPLHLAAKRGFDKIVIVLLEHGADGSMKENTIGGMALHLAVQDDHLKVVEALVASGADVNAKINGSVTPLHLGTLAGSLSMVKFLLSSGAYFDAKIEDESNILAVHLAQGRGFLHIMWVLRLIEKLFRAVKRNDALDAEKCLREGALVNSKSIHLATPLHYASWKGYINIVNLLLKNGADVNITTELNLAPLHYAAKFNCIEVVHSLLKHGAMFDIASRKDNKTPLNFAQDATESEAVYILQLVNRFFQDAENGNYDVVKELESLRDSDSLAFLSVTNARNSRGQTLMQVAVSVANRRNDIMNSLIKIIGGNKSV